MGRFQQRVGWMLLAASVLVGTSAEALPQFSRRTGISCSGCHDAWPRLNDFGELYRDRGYRLNNIDYDWSGILSSFPASFRTTVGYQYTATTEQPSDQGPITVSSGSIRFPEADIYVGGALSNHVSTYVDIAGFGKEGTASLESAWVRLNELGTNWVNLKVGLQELDLPFSKHRAHTIYSPFLIYGYHPGGSANPFTLDENQLGVEISGHQNRPGFRYSVAVASSNDLASGNVWSAPTVYTHLTQTFLPRSSAISRVRLGVMGDLGWTPTRFAPLTPESGTPQPIPGTGSANAMHGHVGGDVQVSFLPLARPVTLTAVWLYGQDSAALVPNGTQDARFHGGFVQLDYIPLLGLIAGVRFDGVYNLRQADPAQPLENGQQLGFAVFARYLVWMSTWGSAAVHIEASTVKTENAGVTPNTPVRGSSIFAGIDFLL